MTMPRFNAETALYQTSAHYRTGRYNSSAQTASPIWPAAVDDDIWGHEVIVVRDPWAPLTEPPVIIDSGPTPGDSEPVEAGKGPKGKGGKGKDSPAPKRPVRRPVNLGRDCKGTEAGPDLAQAEIECGAKAKPGGLLRTLRCFDNPDGSVEPVCCYADKKGNITLCISDIEQVPT